MAERTLNVRFKQKYDTSVNWYDRNPILLAGEIGIESDTNKMKVGDGTTNWNDLAYIGDSSNIDPSQFALKSELDEKLTKLPRQFVAELNIKPADSGWGYSSYYHVCSIPMATLTNFILKVSSVYGMTNPDAMWDETIYFTRYSSNCYAKYTTTTGEETRVRFSSTSGGLVDIYYSGSAGSYVVFELYAEPALYGETLADVDFMLEKISSLPTGLTTPTRVETFLLSNYYERLVQSSYPYNVSLWYNKVGHTPTITLQSSNTSELKLGQIPNGANQKQGKLGVSQYGVYLDAFETDSSGTLKNNFIYIQPDNIYIQGNVVPYYSNKQYDIGSTSYAWKNIYAEKFFANGQDISEVFALKSDLPTIDTALSFTSTNPVQNKAVTNRLDNKVDNNVSASGGKQSIINVTGSSIEITQWTAPVEGSFNKIVLNDNGINITGNLILATQDSQIQRVGKSVSWVQGRNGAIVRTTSSGANQYIPVVSAKSQNGSWEMGTYQNDILHLTYITDANYNAGTNATTCQFSISPSGVATINNLPLATTQYVPTINYNSEWSSSIIIGNWVLNFGCHKTGTVNFPIPFTQYPYSFHCGINRGGNTASGYNFCSSITSTSMYIQVGTEWGYWSALGQYK